MDRASNIFDNPLPILKALGLYSRTNRKRVVVCSVVYSILLFFTTTMAFITQLYNTDGNIFEFVTNIEAMNGFLQIMAKIILIAHRQEMLFRILDKTKDFQKTDVTSNAIKTKLDRLATNAILMQKFFLCSVIIVALIVEVGAFREGHLPVGFWRIPNHELLYKLTFISQFLAVPLNSIFAAGFDCLFLALSVEITIQFRILRYCLQELNVSHVISQESEQEYNNKVKLHIKYHIFLLRFSESLQNYFSFAMLIEYITISPLICAEMYATFESDTIEKIIQNLTKCLTMVLQLTIYCFPAHVISSESLAVSDAIYNSDWYSKHFSRVLTPITLMIQRSQRGFMFTAGGLIEINLRTVLVVLRLSWSTCTAMRALKSKH